MRRADVVAGVAFVGCAGLIALVATPFWLFLLTSAAITATIAVSVGVIYDNAGLLSLCQMSFAGLGAWTVGWLNLETDLPFLLMLPFAALVPLVIGVMVGVPALRLRGQNLAVFTLVFAAAVSRVTFADGFPGLIQGNQVSPPSFAAGDAGYFLFCCAVLGLVGLGVTMIRRSPTGGWWSSVRRSERATASLGRSVVLTKLSAFGVSAAIAGLGGGMLVALNGVVSGTSFEPIDSMTILTSALMFGAGNFEGALMAGIFGQLIPNYLRDFGLPQDLAPIIFAVGGLIALSQGEGGLSAAVRGLVRRAGRPGPAGAGTAVLDAGQNRSLRIDRAPVDLDDRQTVLEVRDVSVSYGAVQALQDVSLSIRSESLVGLIGPNGAGKSTLVDTLSGFIADHEGSVLLDGTEVTTLSPQRRTRAGLRRTFQQGHVPPDLTIGGYLQLASTSQTSISAEEAVSHFGLPPKSTPIAGLDVGSRRVLEVCGAVFAQPKIVLLDEPAAGLAGPERERFIEAITDLPTTLGLAIVLIEHDLDIVASLCEDVVVLDFGRVIATGVPQEVFKQTEVVDAYLGAVP